MKRKLFSEFIGTFILIFCGTGAMTINEVTNGAVTHVGVAITWGLVVMAMIYALGDISGAHLNPAVTIAFAYAKKFSWNHVFPYIATQLVGALTASAFLWYLFPASTDLGSTVPSIAPFKAFIIEILLTYILMLVIINVSTGSKEIGTMAGIAIGGVILFEAMFAGPVTKASMNPARSLAPAIFSSNFKDLWIYLTAPVLGALLAVMSCKILKSPNCCEDC